MRRIYSGLCLRRIKLLIFSANHSPESPGERMGRYLWCLSSLILLRDRLRPVLDLNELLFSSIAHLLRNGPVLYVYTLGNYRCFAGTVRSVPGDAARTKYQNYPALIHRCSAYFRCRYFTPIKNLQFERLTLVLTTKLRRLHTGEYQRDFTECLVLCFACNPCVRNGNLNSNPKK
jgi:hypothetical protein